MPEQFDYGKDIVGFSKDFIKYDIRSWDKKAKKKESLFQ